MGIDTGSTSWHMESGMPTVPVGVMRDACIGSAVCELAITAKFDLALFRKL